MFPSGPRNPVDNLLFILQSQEGMGYTDVDLDMASFAVLRAECERRGLMHEMKKSYDCLEKAVLEILELADAAMWIARTSGRITVGDTEKARSLVKDDIESWPAGWQENPGISQ